MSSTWNLRYFSHFFTQVGISAITFMLGMSLRDALQPSIQYMTGTNGDTVYGRWCIVFTQCVFSMIVIYIMYTMGIIDTLPLV